MLGRRGPWTTLSTAVEGRPRQLCWWWQRSTEHGKGGWIGVSADNNYYYTRRGFANAVLLRVKRMKRVRGLGGWLASMVARYFARLRLGVKRDKGSSRGRGDVEGFLNGIVMRVSRVLALSTLLFLTLRFPCSPPISALPLPPPLSVRFTPANVIRLSFSLSLSLSCERPRSPTVRTAFVVTRTPSTSMCASGDRGSRVAYPKELIQPPPLRSYPRTSLLVPRR